MRNHYKDNFSKIVEHRTYIQLEIYQLKTFIEREGVKMSKNKCSSLMYAPILGDFRVGIEVDIKT